MIIEGTIFSFFRRKIRRTISSKIERLFIICFLARGRELRIEGERLECFPLLVEINSRVPSIDAKGRGGRTRENRERNAGFEFDGRGIRGGKFEKRKEGKRNVQIRICFRVRVVNRC